MKHLKVLNYIFKRIKLNDAQGYWQSMSQIKKITYSEMDDAYVIHHKEHDEIGWFKFPFEPYWDDEEKALIVRSKCKLARILLG